MINTIMFDLDGTLLPITQQDFLDTYIGELAKVFVRLELDAPAAVKALWAGTKAMVENDGQKLNCQRFWETFCSMLSLTDEQFRRAERSCDAFYSNEFDIVRRVMKPHDPALPRRMIDMLKAGGYDIVLATSPLFPTCAVTTRLAWIGLTPDDFCYITDYTNSSFCKPNLAYYEQILKHLDRQPQQCLMVGNNTREDMVAAQIGIETYLVTDCVENEAGLDIASFRNGTMAQVEVFLATLKG